MSTIDRVSQWSHRIFNSTATEQNVRRESTSNPFAKSNFQKNILMEDVFESSSKSKSVSFTSNITQGTKRIYSTFVGSISDFGKKINGGIESVKDFGRRMKDGAVSAWNKVCEIGNTEIHLKEGIKKSYEAVVNVLKADVSTLINSREKEITKMSKMDPHTEIKPMLSDAIKALEEEMTIAA